MKMITKIFLCALVAIALACTIYAKQNEEKEKKYRGKPEKVEAVARADKKDTETKEKKDKVPVVGKPPHDPNDRPFSVPDAGSTAALLGLALAVVGLAQRRWTSSLTEKP
jgi:VPDSG-CTERM motif